MGDSVFIGVDLGSAVDTMVVARKRGDLIEIVDAWDGKTARRRARDMHAGISSMIAWSSTAGLDRRKRKRAARKASEAAKREWDRNESLTVEKSPV